MKADVKGIGWTSLYNLLDDVVKEILHGRGVVIVDPCGIGRDLLLMQIRDRLLQKMEKKMITQSEYAHFMNHIVVADQDAPVSNQLNHLTIVLNIQWELVNISVSKNEEREEGESGPGKGKGVVGRI